MLREDESDFKLYYKTGWQTDAPKNSIGTHSLGWIVGFLEVGGNVHFFATNIETNNTRVNFASARLDITKKILTDLKLMSNS